jgi:hypothetical protein
MKWVKETFSDGDKPSMSRQICFVFVVVFLIMEAYGHKVTDQFVSLMQGAFTWAFGSGAVSKAKEVAHAINEKIRKPESEADV